MTTHLPGSDRPADKVGGHWLLARAGKKVLRPGGRETTDWLLDQADVAGRTVVEFAPGLGVTARAVLARGPGRYLGVDSDPAASARLDDLLAPPHRAVTADASATGLDDACADMVLGEAMLTMQGDRTKREIMAEAARLLRPGGTYAVHEMALTPDDLPDVVATDIRATLAKTIRVNARPLTIAEWVTLAEDTGFEVTATYVTDMGLLDPRRLVADEGVFGVARIAFNVARQPDVRRRVLAMRRVFTEHRAHLRGVGLILTKR